MRVRRTNAAPKVSLSSGKSASCRASRTPMRSKATMWRAPRQSPVIAAAPFSSEPPAGMQGGDAAGQVSVFDPGQSGLLQAPGQFVLGRKAADTFGEVAIGLGSPATQP